MRLHVLFYFPTLRKGIRPSRVAILPAVTTRRVTGAPTRLSGPFYPCVSFLELAVSLLVRTFRSSPRQGCRGPLPACVLGSTHVTVVTLHVSVVMPTRLSGPFLHLRTRQYARYGRYLARSGRYADKAVGVLYVLPRQGCRGPLSPCVLGSTHLPHLCTRQYALHPDKAVGALYPLVY